jgi:hypothetical protein
MAKLKDHNFPIESFIGGFYISERVCDNLINYFKDNHLAAKPGAIGGTDAGPVINTNIKESTDLHLTPNERCVPVSEYLSELGGALAEYQNKYKMLNRIKRFSLSGSWNIQYYKAGQGYKEWHCERSFNNKRILVWMTYLNDVPDGGTEFMYQKITSPAKKGLTLFWPTDWTHTHRGQISEKSEKYIATGWLNFVDD